MNIRLTVDQSRRHARRIVERTVEATLVADVELRLTATYAGLPSDRVVAAVRDAHSHFAESPIRDFVPLSVDRQASEFLAKASQPAMA